ncbi:GNAT family N-acetyltransferase [Geothrix oryzisoli]|uniref:GNAT family N-acetyltransferase n=1 Tax=Geothrix oryzisoli TaxID=2922721 RepID=UPI001FAD25D1|nr:GNAT family N-acetyltransferase [Geothrix oryzisoli]
MSGDPEPEVRRLAEGAPLPDWVTRLDRQTFGEAWRGLAAHEALWVIPELAFARWSRVPAAGEAELLRIAVASEARGQGLGRAVLEACQRELAGEGLVHLFLEVRPTNLAAIRLYERCGWEPCGCRPRYYSDGEDALLFQRGGGAQG